MSERIDVLRSTKNALQTNSTSHLKFCLGIGSPVPKVSREVSQNTARVIFRIKEALNVNLFQQVRVPYELELKNSKTYLTWVTNHPSPLKSLHPRRKGVEYIEGLPKATEAYSVSELQQMDIIGVYVKMSKDDYYSREFEERKK